MSADPVLQAVLRSAADATTATHGWIVAVDGDELEVVAAFGPLADSLLGSSVSAGAGNAGFVVSSGQPVAMRPRPDDPQPAEGVPGLLPDRPASILCVPCQGDDAVQGALEVVDKEGGVPFSFDDVELVTLLAGIAGAAIEHRSELGGEVPSPNELASDLQRLASADPVRYASVASVMGSLLGSA